MSPVLLSKLKRVIRPLRPAWRRQQADLMRQYTEFLAKHRSSIASQLNALPVDRTALVVGYDSVKLATFQTPLLVALRLAGYRIAVLAPSAAGATAAFYRSVGVSTVIGVEHVGTTLREIALPNLLTQEDILGIEYGGVEIGRFVVSTLMRQLRLGSIDPLKPEVAARLPLAILASKQAVDVARNVVERVKPKLVCFYDRGYTPDGELFAVALKTGAQAMTLNAAHRSGSIISKRYTNHNRDQHFAAPSSAVWRALRAMDWSDCRWQALKDEIEQSYRNGTWYDEVGTQFNKKVSSRGDIFSSLELDPDKKVAVIFPHLFWDATFFWGEDLFADYRDWFCQAIKAAAANDRLNWIIKVHPASLVKDVRDGYRGESSEAIAIRETLGDLPAHIKLISPDSPISTFSLFDVMDYCLTVRGTIGIEAAIFGASVLTAGTGRYDGYGFTIDSSSREEYLGRLAALEDVAPPTPSQLELARRYAYGLFLLRPLKLDSIRFQYLKNASASLQIELGLKDGQQLATCPDLKVLASWLAAPGEEDLVGRAMGVGSETTHAQIEF